jgi:hypothetical protein
MIRLSTIQNCFFCPLNLNLFHISQCSKALAYVITGIAVAALGLLAASIQQYPLCIGLGIIAAGFIVKGINKYSIKVSKSVKKVSVVDKVSAVVTIPASEKMIGKVVGKTSVIDKLDQMPHDVTITERAHGEHNDQVIFYAYIDESGKSKEVGSMALEWLRIKENGKYGSKNRGSIDYDCIHPNQYYGGRKTLGGENLSKVYINEMYSTSKQKYSGVGTALFQIAIEHAYRLGCEGRLELDAAWNSHGFHYKQGMRCSYSKNDQKIVEELTDAKAAERESNTKELGSISMYMPQDGIQMWKKKIMEHPILFN